MNAVAAASKAEEVAPGVLALANRPGVVRAARRDAAGRAARAGARSPGLLEQRRELPGTIGSFYTALLGTESARRKPGYANSAPLWSRPRGAAWRRALTIAWTSGSHTELVGTAAPELWTAHGTGSSAR